MNTPPRKARPEDAAQLPLFAGYETLPLGDGSHRLIPLPPRAKLTVKQAAKVAGVPVESIYRAFESGDLAGERPSPRRIKVFSDSLAAWQQAIRDPKHWTEERKKHYRRKK